MGQQRTPNGAVPPRFAVCQNHFGQTASWGQSSPRATTGAPVTAYRETSPLGVRLAEGIGLLASGGLHRPPPLCIPQNSLLGSAQTLFNNTTIIAQFFRVVKGFVRYFYKIPHKSPAPPFGIKASYQTVPVWPWIYASSRAILLYRPAPTWSAYGLVPPRTPSSGAKGHIC